MSKKKIPCLYCDWNFDGICASHGPADINEPDTYGSTIEETIKRFPDGCDEFRPKFEYRLEFYTDIDIDAVGKLKGFKSIKPKLK